MVDINPPKETLDNTLYLKCNVASWDQQASTFQKAFDWQHRLDFVALNAGIDDRDDIFNTISGDPARPPKEPNMLTISVCFTAVYYGIKLAAHYISLDSKAAGKTRPGGKVVVTASAAGIYPVKLPISPLSQYRADSDLKECSCSSVLRCKDWACGPGSITRCHFAYIQY